MPQQFGLAFSACADGREAEMRPMTYRQDVILAYENIDFANEKIVVAVVGLDFFDRLQHCKQRIAVLLDLRSLMAGPRIFNGERMQVELLRHRPVELVLHSVVPEGHGPAALREPVRRVLLGAAGPLHDAIHCDLGDCNDLSHSLLSLSSFVSNPLFRR